MASDPPIAVPTEVVDSDKHNVTAEAKAPSSISAEPASSSAEAPAAASAKHAQPAAPLATSVSNLPPPSADAPAKSTTDEATAVAAAAVIATAAVASTEAAHAPQSTASATTAVVEPAKATSVEDAPDPDEDDLDDLDDVLDQFKISEPKTTFVPPAAAPGPSSDFTPLIPQGATASIPAGGPSAPAGLLPDDDDFARQLQAGMADLLSEMDSNPDMARQLEEMMKEMGAAAAAGGMGGDASMEDARSAGDAGAAGQAPPGDFQDTIRKTMERMQTSSESASAAAAESGNEDFLATLLREMEAGGSGLGSDEDFSKMLMGMMEQLTNKEILYEPMKELNDKFPAWMAEHGTGLSKEDSERYTLQQVLVREIVEKFEEPGYSDENAQSREYIVDRMQKMQAAGSPPPDLVGDMNAAQEALGDLDGGCPTQ